MTANTVMTTFKLDPNNPPELTAEEAAQLDAAPIDYSDIPQIPPGFWDRKRSPKPVLQRRKP